ncbi:NitT/TauT family transport system permease protein [Micromonospora sp. Llam0]|uniref:ABC transporter permease n=1 Tax=Micromonospora sp. Llam0 TaxID=2485143 RepID=UPI000F4917DA|nr:ABC transporter permease [Micromonospora sp. Llam0]ROO51835.1 NitT/TauT family transport system permease protein [Micromonospora sp. Llam0]
MTVLKPAQAPPVRAATTAAVRRPAGGRVAAVGLPLLGVAVTVTAWWLVTSVFNLVHSVVLPPPQDVYAAFSLRMPRLLEHALATTTSTVVGFAISTVIGVLIGLALAGSQVAERMFAPLLVALNAVPKIVLAPLLVVTLGWGQQSILTMVFLLCFFPIVLSTVTGLTSTPADLAELARSLDASRWQTFRKIRFPAALPQIFVGLKVAMPLAAIGAVIGEFQAGEEGLGYMTLQFSGMGENSAAWAAIVLIGLMSILLYFALVGFERLLLPWVRETTSAR